MPAWLRARHLNGIRNATHADRERAMSYAISPHLCFDGRCREAMLFYQQVLGGTIETMLTYGETPMAAGTAPRWRDRIIHATLRLDDLELTGVDLPPGEYEHPQGFFVTLSVTGIARARAIYDALCANGSIRVPFQETFWSPGFGVLIDRFDIPWEISTRAHRAE
jgi:PhnB protein